MTEINKIKEKVYSRAYYPKDIRGKYKVLSISGLLFMVSLNNTIITVKP